MSNIRIPDQAELFSLPNLPENSCITFIGMAGAGKTTVGRLVARSLDWAFADSDHIIEAAFGAPLQSVTDSMKTKTKNPSWEKRKPYKTEKSGRQKG